MPTRPGYIWSGSEWVSIGQEAVVAPVSYQTSAPSTPSTGDIWIDSNDDVPGIDTSQFLRWRKTAAGSETSLSGNDDTGLALSYTPNYEQVYLNGVLLVRGQDYTATNGTSITGLTALAANDVVEVFGVVARVVGDVYTQAQADAKYSLQTTTGLVLLNTTTFSGSAAVNIDNVFTTSYRNYLVIFNGSSTGSTDEIRMRLRVSGATTSSNYVFSMIFTGSNYSGVGSYNSGASTTTFFPTGNFRTIGDPTTTYIDIGNPNIASRTSLGFQNNSTSSTATDVFNYVGGGAQLDSTQFDGISLFASSGNITGTIKVYGYK